MSESMGLELENKRLNRGIRHDVLCKPAKIPIFVGFMARERLCSDLMWRNDLLVNKYKLVTSSFLDADEVARGGHPHYQSLLELYAMDVLLNSGMLSPRGFVELKAKRLLMNTAFRDHPKWAMVASKTPWLLGSLMRTTRICHTRNVGLA